MLRRFILAISLAAIAPLLMAPDEPPCGKDCAIQIIEVGWSGRLVTAVVENLRFEEPQRVQVQLYVGERLLIDQVEVELPPIGQEIQVQLDAHGYGSELAVYLPLTGQWSRLDDPRRSR